MPKVYVGNLARSVTSSDLSTLFSRAGEVRGALAVSDKTGSCRGFGFVAMAELDDALAAVSLLNHCELKGRKITIEPLADQPNGAARAKAGAKPAGSSRN